MRFTGRYIQNIETLFDFENLPLERTKDGANERMTDKEREREEGGGRRCKRARNKEDRKRAEEEKVVVRGSSRSKSKVFYVNIE